MGGPWPGSCCEATRLADPAGPSGLPNPHSQAAQRAGACPGRAPAPSSSEDGTPFPLLAYAPSGVSIQGAARPHVSPTWLWAPLPCSLLVSSVPAMHIGPSTTHRTQTQALVPPGPETPPCPPLVLGGRGFSRGSGASQACTPGPRGQHSSDFSDRDQEGNALAMGQPLAGQWATLPGSASWWNRHRAPAECRWGVLKGCRGDWGSCSQGPGLEGPGQLQEGPGLGLTSSSGHKEVGACWDPHPGHLPHQPPRLGIFSRLKLAWGSGPGRDLSS